MDMNGKNGIAIAIAWPKFVGKQTGTWYDKPMTALGFNKDFHYEVGHASLVLINKKDGICRYFDCGRYHAPYQYGRIRDALTDSMLVINSPAIWEQNTLKNFIEILEEIQSNLWTFGMGPLVASYCEIDFEKSFAKAKDMQNIGVIPFGPFTKGGTNCCRFVRTGIIAGNPRLSPARNIFLNYLWHLKPMPISNVDALENKLTMPSSDEGIYLKKSHTKGLYTKDNVFGTLPQPERPSNIPEKSQWLAGEVAGSWFDIQKIESQYMITRYSPEGIEECTGIFMPAFKMELNLDLPYEFTHLSHCSKVSILQGGQILEFKKID